ncbi:hypothetical protein DV738_g5581, partial [Chaetothyriales sp. CBS 135597]
MADTDNAIAEVYRKIEREKALINAATHMRQSTNNATVQARVDSNIRDSRRNITYLETKLQELQIRKMGGSPRQDAGPGPGAAPPPPAHAAQARDAPASLLGAPYADPKPYTQPSHKARPNFSKLDLIKYDTPYLGPKIQLMLSQLEFKLSVEKQYKAGIEKMVRLYQDEGDRKSRSDAEGRRIESNQKVQLLKQALKNGHLEMRIHAIKDVDHAASSRFSRGPETFVVMKVEDNIRAKTRATRNDRWTDEIFSVDIDKANEIELTVYDKSGDRPIPIGFLWIRISDIAEEMRRKKIESEFQQSGWSVPEFQPPPSAPFMPPGDASGAGTTGGFVHTPQPVMIDAWFSLEPAGRIHLEMSFHKQTGGRRPLDLGLNRQGAVRQKKEEVVEKQGHKFVKQQFYNVMRCALCGDFLKYSAGMQCVDCKYTCHTKCYPKVVTKCISKANYETDPDEEKINHRIPHRFDNFSNLGANWCCHCGYLLPLGRKNARKCSECGLTCHAGCQHLVPDFCGMSMIVANQILETINKTKNHNKSSSTSSGMSGRTLRPNSGRPGLQSPTPSLTPDGAPLSPQPGRQFDDHFEQPKPSVVAVSAAQNMYSQPTGPSSPQQNRAPSGRTTSTQAIRAAAAATTGLRPLSQNYDRPAADFTSQRPADRYANARPPQPEINPPQHATYDPRAYDQITRQQQQQQQQQQSQQSTVTISQQPRQAPQQQVSSQQYQPGPAKQQQQPSAQQQQQQQVARKDQALPSGRDEIYDAILADEPLYPIHMPRDSVSILQKLLTREPEHRLGSGPGDAQEIMSHAFFKGVNWDDVYHKRVPTPFKPTVKDPKDTSNFDQEFTSVTPVLTPVQSEAERAEIDGDYEDFDAFGCL